MADPRVTAILTARDEASKVFDKVADKTKKLGQDAGKSFFEMQVKLELLKKAAQLAAEGMRAILSDSEAERISKNFERVKLAASGFFRLLGVQSGAVGISDWIGKQASDAQAFYDSQDPAQVREREVERYRRRFEADAHKNDDIIEAFRQWDVADTLRDLSDVFDEWERGAEEANLVQSYMKMMADEAERMHRADFLGGVSDEIEEMQDKLKNLYDQGREMTRMFFTGLASDWETDFFNMMESRFQGLGEFLRNFFNDILRNLEKVAAHAAAQNLIGFISGGIGALLTGGSAAINLGNLTDVNPNQSQGSFNGNSYEGRAEGGPVYAGRSYVVGERRPERFTPNQSGYISAGGGGGGGVTVVINATDADSVRRLFAREGDFLTTMIVKKIGGSRSFRDGMRGVL